MKVLYVLALVAAVSLARHVKHRRRRPSQDIWDMDHIPSGERVIEQRKFESGKQFEFFYDAQILTGIPQSSKQHAGSRLQCVCRLQFTSDNEVLLQLRHIQMGELNRKVPTPRAMVPMEACDEVPIDKELMAQLEMPVKFNYRQGMISEIRFDGRDLVWSTNIKKAVLNLIQVRMGGSSSDVVSRKEVMRELELNDQLPNEPNFDFFTINEETMEGRCNTSYTIVREPCRWPGCINKVLNVTKSINFEECELRPEIKYNFRFAEICPQCSEKKYNDEEKFLESSTVYQYNITGERDSFVIDSARAESQYIFTPYNERSNVIVTYTNATLVLVKSGSVSREIPVPSSPKEREIDQTLIYSPMWDVRKEKFFMGGEEESFLEKSVYSKIKNKPKLVKGVLTKLIERINNGEHSHMHKDAPRQLARLVKVLRVLKKEEITKVFEMVEEMRGEQRSIAKDMLVDSMGLCGTKSCLSCLLEQTKEEKINPIKASLAIKSFVQSRVVSKEMIKELWQFCKSETCESNGVCKQTCYLTMGSMIGALCRPNQDYLAMEFMLDHKNDKKSMSLCPKETRSMLAKKLMEEFEECSTTYQQILLLKTISNAGLPECVVPLEKIIRNVGPNKPYKTIVRSQAIEALRQLNRIAPKAIQRMLMPIYMNQREIPELRMTALHQLIQTLPERPILDQIARNLVSEPSKHVAGFTITYLKSLANSTNPCERRLADDLKLSLRHANVVPETILPYLSRYWHLDTFSQQYRAGAGLDLGVLKSNVSYLPKDAAVSLHGTVWGFWRKYLLTLGVAQQDLDQILWNIVGVDGSLLETPIINLVEKVSRTEGTKEPAKMLKKIFQKLSVRERSYHKDGETMDPMAMIYLRFFDQEYGMLPMSVDTIPESIKKLFSTGRLNTKKVQQILKSGYNFNYHTGAFIRELSRKIPTSIGMPIVFNMKVPTILSVKDGQVKANLQSRKNMQVMLKAKPSIASTVVMKMEVWNPVINTGVKGIGQLQAHLPIDMKVQVKTKPQVEVKALCEMPTTPYTRTVLQVRTKPISFTKIWPKQITEWIEPEEKVIVGEEWNRIRTFNEEMGEQGLGTKITVRGQWHRKPRSTLPGTPTSSLLSGPNKLSVILSNGEQPPKRIVLKLSSNLFQESKLESLTPRNLEEFFKSSEQSFFETESFETSSSEEIEPLTEEEEEELTHEQYVKNYESSKPTKHLVQMVLAAVGPKKRQISLKLNALCDSQKRKHCAADLTMERTPIPGVENKPIRIKIQGDRLYPETPYTLEDLNEEKKAVVKLSVAYGPVGSMKKLCDIMVQGERSLEQQNLLENSQYHNYYRQKKMRTDFRALFSPVSQYDQMVKASTLTQFKVQVKYDQKELLETCPTCYNMTNEVYRFMKYMNYWNSDVNQLIKNPKNQIRAVVKLDPKSHQLLNITAEMPYERVIFTDLPLPTPVYPMNLRSRSVSILSTRLEDVLTPRCLVGSRRVKTFDQVSYHAPLTTCYSVLSKDCSSPEQPRFVVMMKRISEEGEMKKVKIITEDQVITMKPKCEDCSEPIEVKIDGAEKEIPQGMTKKIEESVITREGPYAKVVIPKVGIRVYFDGYAASIKVSPMYRNTQCGICGHYDGEQEEEFMSADLQSIDSRSKFFRSYLHKDDPQEECKLSPEMEQRLDREEEYRTQELDWEEEEFSSEVNEDMPWLDTSSSEEREGTENESEEFSDETPYDEEETSPIKATKVVETAEHICFSTRPLPRCPGDMYPKETKETSKKVHYKCVDKNEPSVDEFHRQALRMDQVDMEELEEIVESGVTIQPRKETVPVTCTEF